MIGPAVVADGVVKVSDVPVTVAVNNVPPNVTFVVEVNPVPVRVTVVPPMSFPAAGVIFERVGTGSYV